MEQAILILDFDFFDWNAADFYFIWQAHYHRFIFLHADFVKQNNQFSKFPVQTRCTLWIPQGSNFVEAGTNAN